MPQSASLIFCPNAGNGFEDISRIRKAGIQMNTKMSNHEIMVKEKKLNESWRQSKRQQQPIDPLQCLIHLLRGLHELGQFLVGNTVVQQALFQSVGDQADLPMVPDHTDIPISVGHIVLYLKLI